MKGCVGSLLIRIYPVVLSCLTVFRVFDETLYPQLEGQEGFMGVWGFNNICPLPKVITDRTGGQVVAAAIIIHTVCMSMTIVMHDIFALVIAAWTHHSCNRHKVQVSFHKIIHKQQYIYIW